MPVVPVVPVMSVAPVVLVMSVALVVLVMPVMPGRLVACEQRGFTAVVCLIVMYYILIS